MEVSFSRFRKTRLTFTRVNRIPPQSGVAFVLPAHHQLIITDIEGEQVSDVVLFNRADPREKLSSGKTLDFEETLLITAGHHLWSNRSRRLALIEEDTNGRNDFLLAPCSPETFQIMYGHEGYHPSCFANLYTALEHFEIAPDDVPTAFNVFMNVQFAADGELSVEPPTSRAGDCLRLRALDDDLIVAMTACSAEDSNGGSFKPIGYDVLDAQGKTVQVTAYPSRRPGT